MDQSKNNDLDQFGAVEKPTAEDFQPYVDAGLALTIVAGKDCLLDKWNTRENAITTLDQLCQNFHAHPNYTGVGLLHAWSGTVAIDFDDLTKAIPYFAEHCPEFDVLAAIQNPNNVGIFSGRENRGKLIYRVDDALRFHTKNRSDKEGFEFRCATKKSTSVQDVLPPSIPPGYWQTLQAARRHHEYTEIARVSRTALDGIAHSQGQPSTADQNPRGEETALRELLQSALDTIDPDCDYDTWIGIGMALNSVGEQFFDLWDCWSRLGAKFVEPDCESRWSGFDSDGGISVATLLYHARKANWDQQQAEKAFVAELKLLIKEGILDSLDPAISVIQFFASRDSRQTIRLRSLLKRELALPKGEFNELHGQALTEDGEPNGLTHGEMGSHLLSKIELTPGHVTGCEMQFWRCESGIWRPVPMRARPDTCRRVRRTASLSPSNRLCVNYKECLQQSRGPDFLQRDGGRAGDGAAPLPCRRRQIGQRANSTGSSSQVPYCHRTC